MFDSSGLYSSFEYICCPTKQQTASEISAAVTHAAYRLTGGSKGQLHFRDYNRETHRLTTEMSYQYMLELLREDFVSQISLLKTFWIC